VSRKYPPTMIQVGHAETAAAERRRETARPRLERQPVEPPAWEATPEPTPPPTPKSGRGTRIVVERQVHVAPAGGAVLAADDVFELRQALLMREVHSTGAARDAATYARRNLSRKTNGTS
jgi:hypothetical protein